MDRILPFIQEASKWCEEYREPFVGGGSVFLNAPPFATRWINDADPHICAFFRTVRDNPTALCERVLNTKPTIHMWEKLRLTNPADELELAFKTLFLNRTNYSGVLNARPIGGFGQKSDYSIDCRWNPKMLVDRIKSMSDALQGVDITCEDFLFVISKPSMERVFLFLDPPYYHKGNDLYLKGMSQADHVRLRDMLARTKHLFLLTYDNCQEVRDMYATVPGLYLWETTWKYTLSSVPAERILGKELFISNFPLAEDLQDGKVQQLSVAL